MFESFRAALLQLLDRLKPAGEIMTPNGAPPPGEHGRACAKRLLLAMQVHKLYETARTVGWPHGQLLREQMREHYGLIDARQDLDLKGPLRQLDELDEMAEFWKPDDTAGLDEEEAE
jgi:hypothetical protein